MKKGFTLLEILIVIAIIGILILIFVTQLDNPIGEAEVKKQQVNSTLLESAIKQHKLETESLPFGNKIQKDVSENTQKIIQNLLDNNNSNVTYDSIKDTFYTLDTKKLKDYIKGNFGDMDQYFSSNSKELEGLVFTYETLQSKDLFYSGSYTITGETPVKPPVTVDPPPEEKPDPPITNGCNTNWSSDATIRLPQQGSGTPGDPYLLRTIGEIQGIRLDLEASYKLGNNIEGCVTKDWNNGQGFEPIQDFDGTMEKSDYSIDNLYINRPNEDYVGMFSNAHTTIDESFSVRLKNPTITGRNYVGSITGKQDSFRIYDISVENGNVTGQNHVGLMFGDTQDQMFRFFGTGTVKGKYYVGGISGSGVNIHAKFGYFLGSVEGTEFIGGIAGQEDDMPFLDHVYVSSTLKGKNSQPFFGVIKGPIPYVRAYFNKDKANLASDIGEGYTENELKSRSTYDWWNEFDTYFNIDPNVNDGFPYLK
ncbi:prepilin-type N-terminal cleavage/methylation domain-containing protein [Bacillus luti]|uniref:prepilin-type N-terminal cleavage/methylation domain-containing protein n=1 Tax=Bacillus luti TaxID=2026191 RepID=UPI0012E7EBBA|nr:prepilin-type N-terminal cleavage/methylation domain-containing protein [Bacillus luti]